MNLRSPLVATCFTFAMTIVSTMGCLAKLLDWPRAFPRSSHSTVAFNLKGRYSRSRLYPPGKKIRMEPSRSPLFNDGLRNVHFSYRLGDRIVNTSDSNRNESEIEVLAKGHQSKCCRRIRRLAVCRSFPTNTAHRLVRYQDADGVWEVVQGITRVNPRWTEVRSIVAPGKKRQRNWTMRIATNTIDPDILRDFLRKQIKNANNPAEYETLVDFFSTGRTIHASHGGADTDSKPVPRPT